MFLSKVYHHNHHQHRTDDSDASSVAALFDGDDISCGHNKSNRDRSNMRSNFFRLFGSSSNSDIRSYSKQQYNKSKMETTNRTFLVSSRRKKTQQPSSSHSSTRKNSSNKKTTTSQQHPKFDPKQEIISLDTYAFVLNLNDISINAIGMEKLVQAARPPKHLRKKHKDVVARALVYGGKPGSSAQKLRAAFVSFLYTNNNNNEKRKKDGSSSQGEHETTAVLRGRKGSESSTDHSTDVDDSFSASSTTEDCHDSSNYLEGSGDHRHRLLDAAFDFHSTNDDDERYCLDNNGVCCPRGTNYGALHLMALKVLIAAMEQILSTTATRQRHGKTCKSPPQIHFDKDDFWPKIVDTLRNNLEILYDGDKITGCTLKCLILLYSLDPILVRRLLQHSFIPFLHHALVEYSEGGRHVAYHKNPWILNEATRLLNLALFSMPPPAAPGPTARSKHYGYEDENTTENKKKNKKNHGNNVYQEEEAENNDNKSNDNGITTAHNNTYYNLHRTGDGRFAIEI